ncbi:MAG: hypothetical protein AB7O38_31035, partial [Pirellulaceae bacterium]
PGGGTGKLCLLSALQFHGLTTQAPFEVWMAIDESARQPRVDAPSLRIVRFSGAALTSGVQEHVVEGVTVRVYAPAKTVADCFKYRNKIGIDLAIEALRLPEAAEGDGRRTLAGGQGLPDDERLASLPGGDGATNRQPRDRVASVRQRLMNLSRERGESP